MILRRSVLLVCLLVVVSSVGFCDNAIMGRYNPQQNSFTTEKLEPPLILSWEFTGSRFRGNPAAPVAADGVCYFACGDRVYALDMESGNLKWKYPQDQSLTSVVKATPQIINGKLYFGTVDGKLYCLDGQTGAFQWFFETRGALRCPPITLDGITYLGCDDNSIYTLDADSGDMMWSKPFVSRDDFANGIAVGAGMVVGSSMDGNVYGINASSGKLRWVFRLPSAPVKTSPAMAENVTIVAVGNVMYGLTTRSGQRKWMVQLRSEAASTPATDGSDVIVACHDRKLYCYNVTGRQPALKWTEPADIGGAPLSSPTIADKMVYVTGSRGVVSAFSLADGSLKWRYVFMPSATTLSGAAGMDAASSPVVTNGSLLVLTDDGVLHCFTKTAPDTTPPDVYSATPPNGKQMSGAPPIKFSAVIYDQGSGVDFGSAQMTLDGNAVDLTTDFGAGTVAYTFEAADATKTAVKPLADGVHTVSLAVNDYAGNENKVTWTFTANRMLPPPKRATVASPIGRTNANPNTPSNRTRNSRDTQQGNTGGMESPPPPPPPGMDSPSNTGGRDGRDWRDRRGDFRRGDGAPPAPN